MKNEGGINMKIEVWSDFVCPFCYIGKRRLEMALNDFEHKEEVELVLKVLNLIHNQKRNLMRAFMKL
jgi:Predicted dithiol-disulfide isomerase involved in polyketide biosynthesis